MPDVPGMSEAVGTRGPGFGARRRYLAFHAVCAVSAVASAVAALQDDRVQRIVLVRPAVEVPDSVNEASAASTRTACGFSPDDRVMFFASALNHWDAYRGGLDIIEAIALIKDKVPSARLGTRIVLLM